MKQLSVQFSVYLFHKQIPTKPSKLTNRGLNQEKQVKIDKTICMDPKKTNNIWWTCVCINCFWL